MTRRLKLTFELHGEPGNVAGSARLMLGESLGVCPFCVSPEVEAVNTWTPCYWVECNSCGACGPHSPSPKRYTRPCSDCPMRRDALNGWLGGATPEEYARLAHSDAIVKCHVHGNVQCAGMAIYRRNVCKRVDPPGLVLPADREEVFSTPMEFLEHHGRLPRSRDQQHEGAAS